MDIKTQDLQDRVGNRKNQGQVAKSTFDVIADRHRPGCYRRKSGLGRRRHAAPRELRGFETYISGGLCARKKATVDFSICNRVSLRDNQ